MCFVAYSIASIKERIENLKYIIPIILEQCDQLYVNLVGHNQFPDCLLNNNIIVNEYIAAGSQVRFYDYNNNDAMSHYFTIDDDILYPRNYTDYMLRKMKEYNDKAICCVHGSNVDLAMKKDYYKKKKKTYRFCNELDSDAEVMFPGVGTACFCKEKFMLQSNYMTIDNMSDVYIGTFAVQQGLKVMSVKRDKDWLQPLDGFGKSIWKHNPYSEIDKIINENKTLYLNAQ